VTLTLTRSGKRWGLRFGALPVVLLHHRPTVGRIIDLAAEHAPELDVRDLPVWDLDTSRWLRLGDVPGGAFLRR